MPVRLRSGRQPRFAPARMTRLVVIAVGLAVLPVCAHAQLPLQVSDRFVEVSRAVARTILASELRNVCDTQKDLDSRQRCHIVVDEVTQLFEFALASSSGSRPSLDALVTSLAGRVTQAAFLELTDSALKAQIEDALLRLARTPTDECRSSITALRSALVRCGQSLLFDMHAAGQQTVCRDGLVAPAAAAKACGFAPPTTGSAADPLDVLAGAVTAWLGDATQQSPSEGALAIQELLLNRDGLLSPTARGAYERVAALAARLDKKTTLDSMSQWSVFDDPQKVLDELAAVHCSGKGVEVLKAWREDRYAVYAAVAQAMARGTGLTDAEQKRLARLPHGAGELTCPPGALDEALAGARRYAEFSRWLGPDVKTALLIDRALWAALLGALALDYFQSGDAAALKDHVAPLALRAVARAIAYEERAPQACTQRPGRRSEFTCVRIDAEGQRGALRELKIPDELAPTLRDGRHDHQYVITHYVEARGSVMASQRTCAWQAAAAALGVDVIADAHESVPLCRAGEPGSIIARLESLLEADALLQPIAGVPGLARWAPGAEETMRVRSMVQNFSSPVRVFAALSRALALASQALGREAPASPGASLEKVVPTSPPLADVLASLSAVCDALARARDQDALRLAIALGARVSRPAVDSLLDAHIAPLGECEGDTATPSTRCAARVLVDALYTPTVEYLAEPDPQRRQAFDWPAVVGHAIQRADPLSRSPLLFDVGLGFTLSMNRHGDEQRGHLTVMEKFGIVKRWGDRNAWQAGVFAGGFLDPVVRRIAGDKVDPRWLAGLTFGRRQWSRDFPLGLEAHAALAIPFQFNTDPHAAVALVALVPIDLVFK